MANNTEPPTSPRGRSRLSILLSVLWGAGLLLVVVGIVGLFLLNAPRPRSPVSLDRHAIAAQDPGLIWLAAQAPPPPLTDLAAPTPFELASEPAPHVLAELEETWDRVRAAERSSAAANPLPLSASPASDLLVSQVQELAAAYWKTTRARAELGHDLYLATVDDWYPHYLRGHNYTAFATRTRDRSYAGLQRGQLTSPYRNSLDEVAWMYDLQARYDTTRWEATEAVYKDVTKAELIAFDAAWDDELETRLRALSGTAGEHDLAGIRVPTTLLRSLPTPIPSRIDGEYSQMATQLRAQAEAAAPLSMREPDRMATRASFEDEYRAILEARIDQALAGQAWVETPDAPAEVTAALSDLLYPHAAPGPATKEATP